MEGAQARIRSRRYGRRRKAAADKELCTADSISLVRKNSRVTAVNCVLVKTQQGRIHGVRNSVTGAPEL